MDVPSHRVPQQTPNPPRHLGRLLIAAFAILSCVNAQAEWKLIGGAGRDFVFVDDNGNKDTISVSELDGPELAKTLVRHLDDSAIRQLAANYIIVKKGQIVLLANKPETIDRVKIDQIPERGVVLGYIGDETYAAFATDKTDQLAEGDWLSGPFVRNSSYRYTTILNSEKQVPLFAPVDGRTIVELTKHTLSTVNAVTDNFSMPTFTTEYGRMRIQQDRAKAERARAEAIANEQYEAHKAQQDAVRRQDAAKAAQLKVLNMEAEIATRSLNAIDNQLAAKPGTLPDHNRRQLEEQKAGLLRKMDQIRRQMAAFR